MNLTTNERPSWLWSIGPAYLGVFVWLAYFDRLGLWLADGSGLAWLCSICVLSVLACLALIYEPLAMLGHEQGQGLDALAQRAFGAKGGALLTSSSVGLAAVVFHAVAISVSVKMTMLALVAARLLPGVLLMPARLGGLPVAGAGICIAALFWIYITVMTVRLRITGVVTALMQVYSPVALLLLALTAALVWAAPGESAFSVARIEGSGTEAGRSAFTLVQFVFAYFSFAGVMAVDWGNAVGRKADVRIGGWLSIIVAGSLCSALALVTVSGSIAHASSAPAEETALDLALPFSFHWAILGGIGGSLGALILLLFGLAALAPGCYAAFVAADRLARAGRPFGPASAAWLGGVASFVLVAFRLTDRLEVVYGLLGSLFGPMAGVLVADGWLRRFRREDKPPRVRPAGFLAWGVGTFIGLLPSLGEIVGSPMLLACQPASLLGYLSSAAVYAVVEVGARPATHSQAD